jgi:hypothetical protein
VGKRSDGFERAPQDYYRTWDRRAVVPLLPHLAPATPFVEPCAGDGVLIDHLELSGHRCVYACDIEPRRGDIRRADALKLRWRNRPARGLWITNPPWTRDLMHPIIRHLCAQAPGWFLFDADWAHNVQARPLLPILRMIVSVGRVEWIEGSGQTGKDNVAWYYFDGTTDPTFVEFIGRQ